MTTNTLAPSCGTSAQGKPVDTLADNADLYEAGLSSFASVQLMLAIEDTFDIEFPENLLNRKTFASIAAIAAAVETLSPDSKVA